MLDAIATESDFQEVYQDLIAAMRVDAQTVEGKEKTCTTSYPSMFTWLNIQ